MKQINSRRNILSLLNGAAVKGPVLQSHGYDPELACYVEIMDFEVSNKSRIPDDLPYGVLAEIRQGTMNKARLRARVIDGFFELEDGTEPNFPEQCSMVKNPNQYICLAKQCTQIVPSDFDISTLPQTNLWEATLTPIDDRHSRLTTMYVLEAAVLTDDEWDELLNTHVTVSRTITQTKGNPIVELVSGTTYKHTYYRSLKCGWWLRVEELFNTAYVQSYDTIHNYSWPPVLDRIDFLMWESYSWGYDDPNDTSGGLIKRTSEHYYPNMVWKKEAYSGPCKAHVQQAWQLAPPTLNAVVEGMITTNIQYACPMFTTSTGPCLHEEISLKCDFGTDDSRWVFSTNSTITFPATNYTDWPDSVLASSQVRQHRGGYFGQTVTIYSPGTAGIPV